MKVLGIIPARYDSSRFPGKPLLDLAGKSMIQRVYEGALNCKKINKIVVATDDERILKNVESFGGEVVMTDKHHPSGTDRCGEVIEKFPDYDVVVNVQGDEPLVNSDQLETLISAFNDNQVEIATLGKAIQNDEDLFNPNRIKVVLDKFNRALYFSRNPIPFGASKETSLWRSSFPYLRHIGLYAYRLNTLKELVLLEKTKLEQQESLEQLRWLYHGYRIHVLQTHIETPNIDTPEDVEAVLNLLKSL